MMPHDRLARLRGSHCRGPLQASTKREIEGFVSPSANDTSPTRQRGNAGLPRWRVGLVSRGFLYKKCPAHRLVLASGLLASRRCLLLGVPGLFDLSPELVMGDSSTLFDLLVGLL